MSRVDTLYQHATDITLKHKSTVQYDVVPIQIYDKLTRTNNGIMGHRYVRAMEDFIYDGEVEQLCHV